MLVDHVLLQAQIRTENHKSFFSTLNFFAQKMISVKMAFQSGVSVIVLIHYSSFATDKATLVFLLQVDVQFVGIIEQTAAKPTIVMSFKRRIISVPDSVVLG
eukprot:Lithocolla_globosa_v1_NODE_4489_length_1423_cov_3.383772.p3 type:complete len:102 gc:universal NODE_4489_length_1423_cov_3.383772:790-1095(+)